MVRLVKFLCMFLPISLVPNRVFASTEDTEERKQHSVAITGELSSNTTWQLDASYHWFPLKYVGVGASIGMWKEIGCTDNPSTDNWRFSGDSRNVTNGFFMPSLQLLTPALIKNESVEIGLTAEPGFMINIPYDKVWIEKTIVGVPEEYEKVSYSKGQWLAFHFRAGIYASFGDIAMSLGYVYSNLDIYAMRRNMQYNNISFKDFYPKQNAVSGMYLQVSFSF